MPRKRMLDPSIWTDDSMGMLTPRQQLLFIGLFSNADDAGRIKGAPAAIKLMLPTVYSTVSLPKIAADLAAVCAQLRHLRPYEVDGRAYLYFDNYLDWQKIDHASRSQIPAPPSIKEVDSTNPHRGLTEDSPKTRARLIRGIRLGELDQVNQVRGPARARAETPPEPIDAEKTFEAALVAEFAPLLGGEDRARAAIAKARNHPASLGIDRNQGLRDWLREDAERYAAREEARNGTARRRARRTPATNERSATDLAAIAKYDRIRELVDAEALGGRADATSSPDGAG